MTPKEIALRLSPGARALAANDPSSRTGQEWHVYTQDGDRLTPYLHYGTAGAAWRAAAKLLKRKAAEDYLEAPEQRTPDRETAP